MARTHRRPPISELLLAGAAVAPWLALTGGTGLWVFGAATVTLLSGLELLLHRRQRSADDAALRSAGEALSTLAAEVGLDPGAPGAPSLIVAEVRSRLEELRMSVASLAAIMDAIDEPVLALDAAGVVTGANRSAEAMLGQGSGARAVGKPLDQILPDQHALAVVRGALGGESSRGQTRLLTAEGPRILEIGAERIGADDAPAGSPALVVTLRDVTEQATALQLKTDFVANASHELRTPLSSIKTAAETLADLGDDSPAMRARLVSMIAANAERLEELSRDLLDLSSLETAGTGSVSERIDVVEMARDLRDLFETACAQRRVSLEFEIHDRLRSVWTDGRLLRLVLRNLIDNAVKFAYEDTTVHIRGAAVGEGPGRADARFEVIDRGIGIPLAQQQRIFERFFQVDAARSGSPRRRGTGLGLAIVKHALRALGGTIHVRSVWQQGTTMTVDLPGIVEPRHVSA